MQSTKRNLLVAILILFTTTQAVLSSAAPLYTFTGQVSNERLGISVASAGDVNGDGFADILMGAPGAGAGGMAYVFSGQNGDTIFAFSGEATFDGFGNKVASAGDVNGDGVPDIIVGAPSNDAGGNEAGRAYVFSGLNGSTLHTFTGEAANDQFGWSVASAGDVNNDGFADLIVGTPWNDVAALDAGRAYVFSGLNGDTLYVFTGDMDHSSLGGSVASAGDVNNDGFDDLIVGAFQYSTANSGAGRAYVFSGQNGDTLHIFTGEAAWDNLGKEVASAGDVNNDGFADLILGVKDSDAGSKQAGRVYVFSGLTGDTLYVFTGGASWDGLGNSVSPTGDINGDGHDDFIIGVWGYGVGGRVNVHSGLTGDTLYTITSTTANEDLGNSVASGGDVNNDGIIGLIVGAYSSDAGALRAGQVYVFSGPSGGSGSCCVGVSGNIDDDPGNAVDITDLTFLIDHLFINFPPLACMAEGNVDGDPAGLVDITDLTFLIDHLFINFPPTSVCQ